MPSSPWRLTGQREVSPRQSPPASLVSHAVSVPLSRDRPRPRRSIGLRTRATLFFSVAGLLLSLGLAALTYAVSRNYLLDQRQAAVVNQAQLNAGHIRDRLVARLSSPKITYEDIIGEANTEGNAGFAVLHIGDTTNRYFPKKGD